MISANKIWTHQQRLSSSNFPPAEISWSGELSRDGVQVFKEWMRACETWNTVTVPCSRTNRKHIADNTGVIKELQGFNATSWQPVLKQMYHFCQAWTEMRTQMQRISHTAHFIGFSSSMKSDKRGLWKTHLIYLRLGKNNSGKEKGLKHKSLPKEDKQKL